MKKTITSSWIFLAATLLFTCPASADFKAIPEESRDLYHFQLERNFYADDAAFEADLQELAFKIGELEELKGRVVDSADQLYRAYELTDQLTPLWGKLEVYAYLRYAVDTEDAAPLARVQATSGDLSSRIQFVRSEVQRMDDQTYGKYLKRNPGLKKYAFAIEKDLRYRPHTLPLAQEEILSQLDPYLDPWAEELYQRCVDRTDFPDLVSSAGETLDVNVHYDHLINDTSRAIRRDTWQSNFNSMNEHRDLYAFALIKKMKTKNKLAEMRGFQGYPELSYFDQFLSSNQVNAIYDQIAEHASLYQKTQLLRQDAIRVATGYDSVYAWDRSVTPKGFQKPRWDIVQASEAVIDALRPLGEEYHQELASLFDPRNGRLDLVSGDNRFSGAFAYGYPGAPWQLFSFGYQGYLSEVSTLAHEAGHAVHYKMLANAGAMPIYQDGPSYITETVAMLNELLLVDHLCQQAQGLEERTYFLEQFLEKSVHFIYINFLASLEAAIYKKVAADEIKTADDLDALAMDMGSRYSIYYQIHPEYRGIWKVFHHYYTHPMYNVNYVIAGALSLRIFQGIGEDPSYAESCLKLARHGFDRPAPQMLRETIGVDIGDPALLAGSFELIERKIAELEGLYREAGIPLDGDQ